MAQSLPPNALNAHETMSGNEPATISAAASAVVRSDLRRATTSEADQAWAGVTPRRNLRSLGHSSSEAAASYDPKPGRPNLFFASVPRPPKRRLYQIADHCRRRAFVLAPGQRHPCADLRSGLPGLPGPGQDLVQTGRGAVQKWAENPDLGEKIRTQPNRGDSRPKLDAGWARVICWFSQKVRPLFQPLKPTPA
jgi:hypothetical protein